ncbi:unnamed protein product [Microthlaspi erraticum]|uniref:Uncharacterized protein n=1 Tax=Microthlaspi erraticum TaxID=1685480 RepID=A0A6D2JJJ9_9BRAS|nr:unnamed protein product [Microthlaspi erraticum]
MKMSCEKRSLNSIELRIELRTSPNECGFGFNKWQGKAMRKMQKSMDKMVSKIKKFGEEVSGSSSKKKKVQGSTFPRSRSLLTTPRRLPAQEPHRASSFEPREGRNNTQRRRKVPRPDAPTRPGLDQSSTGRVDLEEPFETLDSSTIQHLTRSFLRAAGPYNRFEQAMLHQGQGSHTHFDEEEGRGAASSIE